MHLIPNEKKEEINFKKRVEELVKSIQEKVYIRKELLEKIVALFLSLKEGTFPGSKPPRGILLYGPPGTGKTLLMKTLAEKLGLSEPLVIRGPEIISEYYGKSERRLRQVFAQAKERAEEEGLAIIFIDEIDSIAPRRDMVKGELEHRIVGQLLSLMDGLEKEQNEEKKGYVIVVGSTNRPEVLDPALRRPGRFDLEIEFDPPNAEERKEILKIILENYAHKHYEELGDDELKEIAEKTVGFTGADLLQLVNEALLKAVLEGREKITYTDLLEAVNRVRPSALRELYIEKPKDRTGEIGDESIKARIKEIAENFCNRKSFKAVLLEPSVWKYADKIASSIAYLICKKIECPYIVVRATWFRSRWFGETENMIRRFFDKIKRCQPCIAYIKSFDAISNAEDEHLHGAILEIADNLEELRESNAKALLLCSVARRKIDPIFEEFFEVFLPKNKQEH